VDKSLGGKFADYLFDQRRFDIHPTPAARSGGEQNP
jgi:hypothetical protein